VRHGGAARARTTLSGFATAEPADTPVAGGA
jgi:hypothetical protein